MNTETTQAAAIVAAAIAQLTTATAVAGGGSVSTAGLVKADGSTPLTANWNAGNFPISSQNSLPVFNVAAYGAVATGGGDQSTSIQAAITAAGAAGGGVVQFNVGTYRYLTGLSITSSNVILRGAGISSTKLFFANGTGVAITFNGISAGGVEALRVICFEDTGNTRTAGIGIYLWNSGNCRVSNVWLSDCWNSLFLDGASTNFIDNLVIDSAVWNGQSNNGVTLTNTSIGNTFVGVYVVATNYGWLFDTGTDTTNLFYCGAQMIPTALTSVGFILNNTGGAHDPQWIHFFGCHAETNTTSGQGWWFLKCHGIELHECQTSWGIYGLSFGGSTAHDVNVHGGLFQLAQYNGIVGAGATDILINGVTISNNGIAAANTYDGILLNDTSKNWRITDNRIGHSIYGAAPPAPAPSAKTQRYGINAMTGGNSTNLLIANNDLSDNLSGGAFLGATLAASTFVKSNLGFNPAAVATPAVPASTVAANNTTGADCGVVVACGAGVTVSAVVIGGVVTGLSVGASSVVFAGVLPTGSSIALTYAGGTPTWGWKGL